MNKTLEKQIDNKLEQYRLELQNKELIAEIQTAKETIASQNEHIAHLYNGMNDALFMLAIIVAILGIAMPMWYNHKSEKMIKEMESLSSNVNDFMMNKFKEWEVEKVDINIDKYIEGKVVHTEFYRWAGFSSISYEQLNKIFNHGVEEAKNSNDKFNDYLKWLTFFIFTQNTFALEETEKIRKKILSYKYFYKLSEVDDVGIEFNMMSSLTLEEKEILANNLINNLEDYSLRRLINYLSDTGTLNKERESFIAKKIIETKDINSLHYLENNENIIDLLFEKGALNEFKLASQNGLNHFNVEGWGNTFCIEIKSYLYKRLQKINFLTKEAIR